MLSKMFSQLRRNVNLVKYMKPYFSTINTFPYHTTPIVYSNSKEKNKHDSEIIK